MSLLSLSSLTPLQSLLSSATDLLGIDPGLSGNDLTVTTSGLTTSLNIAGLSLDFPSTSLLQSGEAGLLTLLDGTRLLPGTSASDDLHGSDADDRLYGADGDDRIAGGSGHDWLYGGAGSDTLDGGDGNDHLYGNSASGGADGADSISAGAGNDYVQGNAGNDWVSGGAGNDRILGGQDSDTLNGDAGNDSINGNFGDDVIDGGDGNDVVRGGKGSDLLLGGAGADHLYGDLGADTMTGGAGADLFHFAPNDAALIGTNTLLGNVDTITDFTHGEDHIALGFAAQGVVYGAAQGVLADLLGYAAGLLTGHGDGQVAAISVGADTVLFYNGAGGQLVDSVIDLHGVSASSITASDFI